jgi:predicted unusual protein kinase regulating ubiquinone biosynthesis (AarF/ABC1/UbiB family)
MKISVVRLYHPAPWGWLYSYRGLLLILRMLELDFIALRYALFRAPLLIAWTRLPGLRNRRSPYDGGLRDVLAPTAGRGSLLVGEDKLGSSLAWLRSIPEASELISALQGNVEPPSRFWSVAGCFIRGLLTDLGPAFLKFGQILSMREEIPPTVRAELQLLQDKIPPMGYKEVKGILERELARPVEEVFEYVEETPIAAASLAQVHRAKLRKEQEEVALKVQRPHLQGAVALDTVIICDIVIGSLRMLLPLFRKTVDTTAFTSSYRDSLAKEINFALEACVQDQIRRRVEEHDIYRQGLKIARPYREYCTGKLLTMELVKNYHRVDRIFDELTPQQLLGFATTRIEGYAPEAPFHLVWAMASFMCDSLVHWGVCHGDAHLGNLYLLEPENEGAGWKMFFCDFGIFVEMTEDEKALLLELVSGLFYHVDGAKSAEAVARAMAEYRGRELSPEKLVKLRGAVGSALQEFMWEERPGAEITMRIKWQQNRSFNIATHLLHVMAGTGLSAPPFYWLVLKNFSNLTTIGAGLWGTFNAVEAWAPQMRKYIKDQAMRELGMRNITDLRDSLPEVLERLREYDRKQVLCCLLTGEEIKPKERCWTSLADERARQKG